MSTLFDKRLSELDAYLQMLINENESIDSKLAADYVDGERENLLEIKNNLETLLGSIKHSIVLLQIAKVSLKTSESSPSPSPPPPPPSLPIRPNRPSKMNASKQSSKQLRQQQQHQRYQEQRNIVTADKFSNGGGSGEGNHDYKNENHDDNDDGEDDDVDDDDDDDFFDAADEQHSKVNSNIILACAGSAGGGERQTLADNDNNKNKELLKSNIQGAAAGLVIDELESSEYQQQQQQQQADIMPPKSERNNNSNELDGESINWDALYEDEDEDDLGSLESQGSVIKHLLSQIRIGMDLTKVVLPTFILERRSLLEMYADFFAHPDLFSAIPEYHSAEERMVQLVRWYLSAFHAGRRSSVAKKPYNPILGEIFKCSWKMNGNETDNDKKEAINNDKNETTTTKANDMRNSVNRKENEQQEEEQLTFIAEQVSHHPPVSAFYAENKKKSISCCAHIYTKSKYLGLSVGVHNIGQGIIKLLNHNETYVCTFPSAYGRSILTVPWVELGGSVSIVCNETGYKANIEFVTKPFYGGKKHKVMGEILRSNNEPFLTIDGEWNGIMYSKTASASAEKEIFVDTTSLPVINKSVQPVTTQESFESRNVWKEVTRALKLQDINTATAAKSFIEQRQRDLLKDRLERGIKWKTRYFEASDDGWLYSNPLFSSPSCDSKASEEDS